MALDWSYLPTCAFQAPIQAIISRMNITIYPPFTLGFLVSLSWRFWHIFYDLEYSRSHTNSEWKYHLNRTLVEHNFWLVHKKTFGSPMYTKKPILIFYSVDTILAVLSYHLTVDTHYSSIGHIIAFISHLIPTAVLFVLCWKLPKFTDDFFIQKELRLTALTLLLSTPISAGIVLVGAIVSHEVVLLLVFNGIFCVSIVIAVSLWYIPNTIRQSEIRKSENLICNDDFDAPRCYELRPILFNKQTFKMFMQHLSKEVSTECLLCFVEIVQLELAMKKRFEIVNRDVISSETHANQFEGFDAMTQSSLIRDGFQQSLLKYKPNDLNLLVMEIKAVAYKLFNKYIDISAELVVNISAEERTRLTSLMGDESTWMMCGILPTELYTLYDDVAMVMYRLMNGSFMRFKRKSVYNQACLILDQSNDCHSAAQNGENPEVSLGSSIIYMIRVFSFVMMIYRIYRTSYNKLTIYLSTMTNYHQLV
eukprot:245141_1